MFQIFFWDGNLFSNDCVCMNMLLKMVSQKIGKLRQKNGVNFPACQNVGLAAGRTGK